MVAYYNEFDPYCAQWLRNLIDAGHIPFGDVDERSIIEVDANEIRQYDQWHFFAGLGGWGYAARLAGLPDNAPILTGSPPCQPFSAAGQRKGYADERHLAPHWLRLVAALRPALVFGEQVAAAINKDDWLDDLLNGLEAEGYATGAAVLPACGLGAPHIRQRLWIVGRLGDTNNIGQSGQGQVGRSSNSETKGKGQVNRVVNDGGCSGMADAADNGHAAAENRRSTQTQQEERRLFKSEGACSHGGLADAKGTGAGENERGLRQERGDGGEDVRPTHATQAEWDDPDWLFCRDGKWRPVESGTFPLADGIPSRVGRLRAYGNAIVPQVAAEIIKETITLDY